MDLYPGLEDGDISEMLLDKETPPSYIKGGWKALGLKAHTPPDSAIESGGYRAFTQVEEPFTCEQAMCEALQMPSVRLKAPAYKTKAVE